MSDLFTDTPAELAENADGAPDASLIGCGEACGVQGLPWYNFTRGGVSPEAARRRFLVALAKLPPKMRRRVLTRLRAATLRARVAGIRSITPSVGWDLSVGRCPLSHVTGILTP